jgi:plastocyanin
VRALVAILALALAFTGCATPFGEPRAPACSFPDTFRGQPVAAHVRIRDGRFEVATLTVRVNGTIQFENEESANVTHKIVFDGLGFGTQPFGPCQIGVIVFNRPGAHNATDAADPGMTMRIDVTPT